MHIIYQLIRRELLTAVRTPAECLNPLLFFIIIVSLFPLAISPEPAVLRSLAPGIIWIAALLASLLSLDNLLRIDYEEGTLEQLLLRPFSSSALLAVKVLVHWLISTLALIIVAPFLGSMLYLSFHSVLILMLSLLIGTPVLAFIGAIGLALTLGLRRGGILLALLVLPLYIPILIFGSGAVLAANAGLPAVGHLMLLSALLVLTLTLAPWTLSTALRIGISE